MSDHSYRALEVPTGRSWEPEEYGYRPPGLYADAPGSAIPSHYDTSVGLDHQHNVDATPVDHSLLTEASPNGVVSQEHSTAEYSEQQDLDTKPYGRPLRRYYFRAIVGTISPIIVVSYLMIIWRKYLADVDRDSSIASGPPGARWVFYSWFVAGVIGLNLSLYGLAGVEAGMLMEPNWKVSDAMRLMLHADRTWSGPGGWYKVLCWMMQVRREKKRQSSFPGRLWTVLALPSIIVFVAWPLSGLWLEMTSGFLHGEPGSGANVVGFLYSNFNANPKGRGPSRGSFATVHIPGFGAAYTREGFDRSEADFLQSVPVALPNKDGVEEIFLTAQNENPIEGKAWGLLLHYDCSIVKKVSDLRLLKDRWPAMDVWGTNSAWPEPGPVDQSVTKRQSQLNPTDPEPVLFQGITNTLFSTFPASTSFPTSTSFEGGVEEEEETTVVQFGEASSIKYMSYRLRNDAILVEARKEPRTNYNGVANLTGESRSLNADAVIETAYESWPIHKTPQAEHPCKLPADTADNPATAHCYYDLDNGTTDHYPEIDRKRIFEVLLWQNISPEGGWGSSEFNTSLYNLTIDHSIDELRGEYVTPDTNFKTGFEEGADKGGESLSAIGVTCTSSSSVGTADIDGVQSTCSNFERTDSPIPARKGDCARRFGAETLACTLDLDSDGWFPWLFESVGAPAPLDRSNPDQLLGLQDWRENVQLTYLQASQLRQSMLQAFSNYAIRLMYNDGRDFIGADGSRLRSYNPDVQAFVSGTVITPGVVPAIIPVVLFGVWALISSTLCLAYGFRRRWSATLDGHTLFRLGVELSNSHKVKLQRHSTVAEVEECSALYEIPGFVGDMDHASIEGRIALVEGKLNEIAARKGKLYQ